MQSVPGVPLYYNYDHLGSVNFPDYDNAISFIQERAVTLRSLLGCGRCNLWVVDGSNF